MPPGLPQVNIVLNWFEELRRALHASETTHRHLALDRRIPLTHERRRFRGNVSWSNLWKTAKTAVEILWKA